MGSRDDLLHAVLDEMVADLRPILAEGADARERIASVVREARDEFLDGMCTLQLANEVGRGNELSFRAQVALAEELTAAGIDGDDAAPMLRSLLFLVGGFVVIEQQYRERDPAEFATGDLWAAMEATGIAPTLAAAIGRADRHRRPCSPTPSRPAFSTRCSGRPEVGPDRGRADATMPAAGVVHLVVVRGAVGPED